VGVAFRDLLGLTVYPKIGRPCSRIQWKAVRARTSSGLRPFGTLKDTYHPPGNCADRTLLLANWNWEAWGIRSPVTLFAFSSAFMASAVTTPSSTHGNTHWTQNRSEFPYGMSILGATGAMAVAVVAVGGAGVWATVGTGAGAAAAAAYVPLALLAACWYDGRGGGLCWGLLRGGNDGDGGRGFVPCPAHRSWRLREPAHHLSFLSFSADPSLRRGVRLCTSFSVAALPRGASNCGSSSFLFAALPRGVGDVGSWEGWTRRGPLHCVTAGIELFNLV
jgi:hypothetical protein